VVSRWGPAGIGRDGASVIRGTCVVCVHGAGRTEQTNESGGMKPPCTLVEKEGTIEEGSRVAAHGQGRRKNDWKHPNGRKEGTTCTHIFAHNDA